MRCMLSAPPSRRALEHLRGTIAGRLLQRRKVVGGVQHAAGHLRPVVGERRLHLRDGRALRCGSACRASDRGPARGRVHLSAMPTPPVKPILPSTTRSLRWVRLLRRLSVYQCGGWYFSISTPASRISSSAASSIFWLPTQSSITCTLHAVARALGERVGELPCRSSPDQ